LAIGFGVGMICCMAQATLTRNINSKGVLDSNSVMFHFLFPGIFAGIFSAILEGANENLLPSTLYPFNGKIGRTAV
jgi:hypothetical protein